jgi:alpha-L-fucosidase
MKSHPLSRRCFLGALGAVPLLASITRDAFAQSQANLQDFVNLRFGMFNHFNMGTFTNEEWATPNRDPALFAPSAVNCEQWADAAVRAKMQYGVLTTKHHDGFSLWPTAFGSYNVKNASYKEDIVAQYVSAFRSRGLKVGLYFSIWDRTNGVQALGGHVSDANQTITPLDINLVLGQIRELLTNYGTIDIFITDGYAWQMGQQQVPYQQIRNLVRSLQPNCVMIDHGALSVPWLGDAIYFEEPLGVTAPSDNTYAAVQGQTISRGWFWHPSTPTEGLMSRDAIVQHLQSLEPMWVSFILNCPPNRNGLLDTNIVNRLAEVGAAWAGPNTSRAGLPVQQVRAEWPVTPVAAYATAFHAGEPAWNAIDGRSDKGSETCWSTWGTSPSLPHSITVDLGGVWSNVSTLEYLPKQWGRNNATDGDITSYTVYTSSDGVNWVQVASGNWASNRNVKVAEWPNRSVGYVRLEVHAAAGGYANVSGLIIGGRSAKPELVSRPFPVTGTTYRIQARHSGKVADVMNCGRANGTDVRQWSWLTNNCQRFTFELVGDNTGYYKIRNVASGKLVEVGGLSRADGGNVQIWADDNVPQQHWAVTPVGDGAYVLTNRLSRKAMNVKDGGTADGADIDQLEYTGLAQAQFLIIPS